MARRRRRSENATIKYFDYNLLFIIIFLVGFGLVMIYSVSSFEAQKTFHDAGYYLKHQFLTVIIGFFMMIIVSRIPSRFWQIMHKPAYIVAFLLCFAVLIPGIGVEINGSRRWLGVGGFTVQPSELAKIAVIICVAAILCRMPNKISSLWESIKVLLYMLPVIAVIAISNLSTAIIVAGICVIMIFVASPKTMQYIVLLILGFVAIAIFTLAQSYRMDRIQAWLHPEEHPDEAYQTLQGLYAIGSGGLFGKGLGGSMQKMGGVPEAQNDFIFSIICEELGLFGAICVILLFVLLIWRFMVIANNSKTLFSALVVVGVMAHISLQVVLNLMVVTNTIPNTGVTLPFISYGGTSVIILLTEMGLVLGISREIQFDALHPEE